MLCLAGRPPNLLLFTLCRWLGYSQAVRTGGPCRLSMTLHPHCRRTCRYQNWVQQMVTSFDRQLTDVFAVQSEIAGVVADALAVRVATTKLTVGGTANVAAYDAFLKGRALFNSDGGETADRAAKLKLVTYPLRKICATYVAKTSARTKRGARTARSFAPKPLAFRAAPEHPARITGIACAASGAFQSLVRSPRTPMIPRSSG